jgi:hypothetical protein
LCFLFNITDDDDVTLQATLVKVLLYLKLAVRNAIPLAPAKLTKSVLTSMGEQLINSSTLSTQTNVLIPPPASLAAKLVRQKDSHTPLPM